MFILLAFLIPFLIPYWLLSDLGLWIERRWRDRYWVQETGYWIKALAPALALLPIAALLLVMLHRVHKLKGNS